MNYSPRNFAGKVIDQHPDLAEVVLSYHERTLTVYREQLAIASAEEVTLNFAEQVDEALAENGVLASWAGTRA